MICLELHNNLIKGSSRAIGCKAMDTILPISILQKYVGEHRCISKHLGCRECMNCETKVLHECYLEAYKDRI